ncbi:uncharacterized protein LOC130712667 [Lotus japonicus]|uniref:uncharacterized protein LOC130712667 n=1 Tax=Lotus japonicus TaxID=34305 RepID=UPI00258E0F68|nr:uncharacterized protein LOC130712667 [Lotus japonicus]
MAAMDVEVDKAPPDDGATPKMPFRDKLMGGGGKAPPRKDYKDLVEQGKMKISLVENNRLLPQITTDKAVLDEMSAPWKEALVVCLLGKTLGFRTMKSKLASTWRLSGDFDLLDINNGFNMVKLDNQEDREKVINGGPWMIFDHYLAVSKWSREFIAPASRITSTLAWVRIPGLNVVFYDESYLLSVARVIGTPIKVDRNTLQADRGRFARICVELDLTKPVVGKVCLEGYWYKIEYEGLHVICTKCGCYEHRSRECNAMPVNVPQADASPTNTPRAEPSNPSSEGALEIAGCDPRVTQDPKESTVEDAMIVMADTTPVEETTKIGESGGAVNTGKLAEDFEVIGDWMIVTKRKKKPAMQQGVKPGTIKGGMSGKSSATHGNQTSLGINGITNFGGFSVGPIKRVQQKNLENKKRQFRTIDPEGSGGPGSEVNYLRAQQTGTKSLNGEQITCELGQLYTASAPSRDQLQHIGAHGIQAPPISNV